MHEAKSNLSALAEKVRAGERVVIARAGKPWVELAPYLKTVRKPGRLKGKISIGRDFEADNAEIADWFEGKS
jgi:antitoxin (DNA-binding transcriptional repressor) of toxin-antitoxin stability system